MKDHILKAAFVLITIAALVVPRIISLITEDPPPEKTNPWKDGTEFIEVGSLDRFQNACLEKIEPDEKGIEVEILDTVMKTREGVKIWEAWVKVDNQNVICWNRLNSSESPTIEEMQ